jgi:hypothetical protein
MSSKPALLISGAMTACSVACVLATAAIPAGAGTRCAKLDRRHLAARDIRTFGSLGCARARLVIARYFARASRANDICRRDRFTEPGCAVARFDCATTRAADGRLSGRCQTPPGDPPRSGGGLRVVRFREYDDHLPVSPRGLTG